jgi:hypothetical protein
MIGIRSRRPDQPKYRLRHRQLPRPRLGNNVRIDDDDDFVGAQWWADLHPSAPSARHEFMGKHHRRGDWRVQQRQQLVWLS